MPRTPAVALVLAALCVLAGCNGVVAPTGPTTPTGTPVPTGTPASTGDGGTTSDGGMPEPTPTAPPAADRLGWEGGYRYDDPLAVNVTDGLNATEREAVVARTMARVELIRGLEFTESVETEVITRREFRERDVRFVRRGDPRVTEAFWEALFLVGDGANATAAVREVFGGGVVGYYARGRIVLVSDDDSPRVDTGTLAHELVHALQDQHFDRIRGADTFDARVGRQGLTEGDPVYVERVYGARCASEWSCLPGPRGRSSGDGIARRPGVYLAFVGPYVTGPGFVETLRNRSGGTWTAVNDAYADPPRSSEQVIHPEAYPDEDPVEVTVPDRSGPNWTRVGLETAGEAGIHVMFWANGFVDRPDDVVSTDYRHRLSAGWDGDKLVVYAGSSAGSTDDSAGDADGNGSAGGADADGSVAGAEGNAAGYVWRTVWANATEAREFQRGYETLLRVRMGAVEVAPDTYVSDDGRFADAFRVTRTGDTVTVVNAPTVEALSGVHAP